MSRLNLHKVFKGKLFSPGFLKNIEVVSSERDALLSARSEIRDHIRQEFKELPEMASAQVVFSEAFYKHTRYDHSLQPDLEFKPKFLTQGSFQYKTVNWPAKLPPQQVDLDDGIYVPMPFYLGQPTLKASVYFDVVERAISKLCEDKGWRLDTSKNSCVRVELNSGKSHIDLPLYGVPDKEFDRLTKEMASDSLDFSQTYIYEAMKDYRSPFRIDSNQVKLATREDDWILSDPQKIHDWFNDAVRDHGEQLRDVCRLLKAWRDYNWNECKLSSISLMTVAVEAYDNAFGNPDGSRPAEDRLDIALLQTARYLADALHGAIINPVLPEEHNNLASGWSQQERGDFILKAYELVEKVDHALNAGFRKEAALGQICDVFGERVPMEVGLVEFTNGPKDEVLSTAPAYQAAPEVMEHKSG
ncbi:CBASS cGAMP synthase [Kordiimonas lipolytica]|uniref:Cyclic GMP-AMP synthase n=1 Tax=Kordiimonas lipolytica TaxID=1662421 RepID=A0ABV8UFG5_9PROT|nr:hypothetical protein [Kordiimonas lipolytica]